MSYNPNIHHRKSIRLKGYDYSQQGLYFITICCQNMKCLFGQIIANPQIVVHNVPKAKMVLNDAGKMIETEWLALTNRFTNIILHEFIVMPNHFHGIIEITAGAPLVGAQITNDVGAHTPNDVVTHTPNDVISGSKGRPQGCAPTTTTIGDIMDAFKSITTVKYINGVKTSFWQPFNGKMWQRNYYDHIIRNEIAYQRISNYIINNPSKWLEDKFFSTPNLPQ